MKKLRPEGEVLFPKIMQHSIRVPDLNHGPTRPARIQGASAPAVLGCFLPAPRIQPAPVELCVPTALAIGAA